MIKKIKKKYILIYGAKSTSFIISEMIDKKNFELKFIFDSFMKKAEFKTTAIFYNKEKELENNVYPSFILIP